MSDKMGNLLLNWPSWVGSLSPGQEFNHNQMMLTQTTQLDCEELCQLNVLGLGNTCKHKQKTVYEELREQLVQSEEGWYKTAPIC